MATQANNVQNHELEDSSCLSERPPVGGGLRGVSAGRPKIALRARGLGSCLTSLHLAHEKDVAELLGIPDDVMQVALLPVAYTKGTDFKRAKRPSPSTIIHYDSW